MSIHASCNATPSDGAARDAPGPGSSPHARATPRRMRHLLDAWGFGISNTAFFQSNCEAKRANKLLANRRHHVPAPRSLSARRRPTAGGPPQTPHPPAQCPPRAQRHGAAPGPRGLRLEAGPPMRLETRPIRILEPLWSHPFQTGSSPFGGRIETTFPKSQDAGSRGGQGAALEPSPSWPWRSSGGPAAGACRPVAAAVPPRPSLLRAPQVRDG